MQQTPRCLQPPTSATPVALTSMDLGTFLSPLIFSNLHYGFIPSLFLSLVNSNCTSYFFPGLTPVEVALSSQFEVGSSFAVLLIR